MPLFAIFYGSFFITIKRDNIGGNRRIVAAAKIMMKNSLSALFISHNVVSPALHACADKTRIVVFMTTIVKSTASGVRWKRMAWNFISNVVLVQKREYGLYGSNGSSRIESAQIGII